mgnify:FL=1
MVQVNWTIQAVSDLKDIADYISKDSKLYAKRQVFKIRNSTAILKTNILVGRKVPEIQDEKIREILEGNYRVVYKIVNKDQVDILTIHHCARDLTCFK